MPNYALMSYIHNKLKTPTVNYPTFSATDGSFLLGKAPERPEAMQLQGPDYDALLKEAESVFNRQGASAAAPVRKKLPTPTFDKENTALEKLAPKESDYITPRAKGDTLAAVLQGAATASAQGGTDLGRTLALAGGAALAAKRELKQEQRQERLDFVGAEQRFLNTKYLATVAQEEAVRDMTAANNQIDFQNAQARYAAAQASIDRTNSAQMRLLDLKFDVAGKQTQLLNTNAELAYNEKLARRQEQMPKIAGDSIVQQLPSGEVVARPINQSRAQQEASFVQKASDANPTAAAFAPAAARYQGRTPEAAKGLLIEAIIAKGLGDEVFGRNIGEFITGKGNDAYGNALQQVRKVLKKEAKLNGVPSEDFASVYGQRQKDLLVQMLLSEFTPDRIARLQKYSYDPEITYGLRAINGRP